MANAATEQVNSRRSGNSLLRLPMVCARTGLKKTQLYALMKADRFPRSLKLGARTTVWSADAIDAWIEIQVLDAELAQKGLSRGQSSN